MYHPAPSSYKASDGAAYECFLGRWTERLATVFVDFVGVPADGPVLDVGCGTGVLAAEVARRNRGRRVIGIDLSEPILRFARTQRGTAANVAFERADVSALPFPDGMFTASLAQLVLNFVPDPLVAIGEMVRVTQSRGLIAGAVWDFCGGLVYQRLFRDTACAIDPSAAVARDRLFSHPLAQPDGLTHLWSAAGIGHCEIGSLTIRIGLRELCRLLGPAAWGPGSGRRWRRRPG